MQNPVSNCALILDLQRTFEKNVNYLRAKTKLEVMDVLHTPLKNLVASQIQIHS